MRCGDAPVEIVEFHRVYGFLIVGFSGKRTLVLCTDCAGRIILKNLLYTAFLGWWGITPFYRAFKGQWVNLRSLFKHPSLPRSLKPLMTLIAYIVPLAAVPVLAALLLFGFPDPGPPGPFAPLSEDVKKFQEEGEKELRAGHPKAAEGYFRKALQGAPKSPALRLGLGHALERQGRLREAEEAYRLALSLVPRIPYRHLRQSLGKLLLKTNRPSQAAEVLKAELDLTPEPLERSLVGFHRLYQDAMRRADRTEAVREEYRARLGKDPRNAVLLYLNGRLEAEGDPGKALTHFRSAQRIAPDFFEAVYAMGRLLLEGGDLSEGIAALRQAWEIGKEIRGESRQVLFSLGEAYRLEGAWEKSSAQFRHLATLFPDSALGPIGLGSVAVLQGKGEDALSHLETAMKGKMPAFARAEASLWRGMALGLLGRGAEARAAIAQAVESAPEPAQRARASIWGAELEVRLFSGEDGEAHWKRARTGGKGRWTEKVAQFWLGEVGEGDFLQAFEERPLKPRAAYARYFAGLKRWISGEKEAGKKWFEEAGGFAEGFLKALVHSLENR
ncbi:MAG: tetratricopeptide repeat protein [Planctomycetota bacterium]|jgi:tetratricopeptide (TPR) repeat protein